MGFDKKVILNKGDYYLVDGDIHFGKDQNYIIPKKSATRQRVHPNPMTVTDIRIFLNPGMNVDWQQASRDAIARWNNLNSSLNLIETTILGNAHIEILYDLHDPGVTLPPTTFGLGDWPSANGLPGVRVWINPDFNACLGGITQAMRISDVQHELGHNFGLTHTNQTFGAIIPGTPVTDNQSVMNGNSACMLNDFSFNDIQAVRFLYPGPPPSIVGFSPICNTSSITYNLENANTPVNWTTSTNLQSISSTDSSITVQPINNFVNGEAFIEAYFLGETIRKDIWIGKPRKPTNFTFYPFSPCLNQNVIATIQNNNPESAGVHYEWRGGAHTFNDQNPFGTEIHFRTYTEIFYHSNIYVKATNACGSSLEYSKIIYVRDCGGGEVDP